MAALTTIVLYDALATPVAHNFVPISHSQKDFVWREKLDGLSVLSSPTVSLHVLPSKDKSLERYRVKCFLPVVETVTGANAYGYTAAPKLAYSLMASSDYIMPQRSTVQQRLDLLKYTKNVLDNTQFSEAFIYGILPF